MLAKEVKMEMFFMCGAAIIIGAFAPDFIRFFVRIAFGITLKSNLF